MNCSPNLKLLADSSFNFICSPQFQECCYPRSGIFIRQIQWSDIPVIDVRYCIDFRAHIHQELNHCQVSGLGGVMQGGHPLSIDGVGVGAMLQNQRLHHVYGICRFIAGCKP